MDLQSLLNKAQVPAALQPQALASFAAAKQAASGLAKYKWRAPFATIPLLRGLPWGADALTRKHDIYGNDDSINGDRSGWLLSGRQPAPLGDTYQQYNEATQQVDTLPAADLVYWGYAWLWKLYEKCGGKKHVRDNLVRWWWLGLRNRASRAFLLAGPEASPDVERWEFDDGKRKIEVWRMGDAWQLIERKRVVGKLGYRRNVGYKINNVVDAFKPRAMLIWTPWCPAKIDD